MEDNHLSILNLAMEEEGKGNFQNALILYNEALEKSNGDPGPVLLEMGKFLFIYGLYEQSLDIFIECHGIGYKADEVENIIMEGYYQPNVEVFENNYNENINNLKPYSFISKSDFPMFDELRYRFIPYSSEKFIIFDMERRKFTNHYYLNADIEDIHEVNDILLFKNEYNHNRIIKCEEETFDYEITDNIKFPLYLYYSDFNEFAEYLQVVQLSNCLSRNRIVFLFGPNDLKDWFSNPQSVFPQSIKNISSIDDDVYIIINDFFTTRDRFVKEEIEKLNNYYTSEMRIDILNRIQNKNPRILFITSRFTSALQYYTRDCAEACKKLGIPYKLIIEKSDIHRCSDYYKLLLINDFKPDIIFLCDHFRWEYPWLSKNMVFISWVQDPLPHIMSAESARNISELDYILNVFYSSTEFKQLNYPINQTIDAPFVVNPDIYKEYYLTEKERLMYQSDICVFSNTGNPEYGQLQFLKIFESSPYYDRIQDAFSYVYQQIYAMFYNEKPIYTVKAYKEIINKALEQYELVMEDAVLESIAESYRLLVGYRILRSVPLEWLHEKGYSMKLWGLEWMEHPVLNMYSQGVAQNGETLSKIISVAKVVIGTNSNISAHPRVYETILSKSFYLGVNIPEEHDWSDIRNYMVEDEEIVFFYSRKDLFTKIDYYLNNETARNEIIQKGKEKILSQLTYEKLMNRVLCEIGEKMTVNKH